MNTSLLVGLCRYNPFKNSYKIFIFLIEDKEEEDSLTLYTDIIRHIKKV